MKLCDLIESANWLSVKLTLLQLYPDQRKLLDEYRCVFENLKEMEPEDNIVKIILTEHECDPDDDNDEETFIDISGYDGAKDENGQTFSYAIEFVKWRKWLGMDLAPETIENYSVLEIIAHCLYEMTFISFDEEEIQNQRKSLNKTIDEIKKIIEEEKIHNSFSIDDLYRRLDEKRSN